MAGFLLGTGVGYLLGLLVAPAPGAETRARIQHRLDERARDKARRIGEQAGEAAYERLKQTVTG
jgi:gas vesicle protein